jgi:lipoprotein-releasing system permease protein
LNFSFYIAKRYSFTKSSNNTINIITKIASAGIVIGAAALFIVLSVFSGLKQFSLSFSNDFDPDLKISSKKGKTIFITPSQEKKIFNIDEIDAKTNIIDERALFIFDEKEEVATLKGIDSLYGKVNNIKKTLFNGQWLKPNTDQAVIGYGISEKLSLGLFDYNNFLEVLVPKPGKGNIENIDQAFNKNQLIPVGIYAINEDLDSKYVFVDLGLAQELLGYQPDQISAIEIKLKPNANEKKVIEELESIFNNQVTIKNRAQLNDSLYKMLNTENTAVYLIFTLVIILTLFTLAGTIIMMIIEKKDNLKTLYNLGTEIKNIRKIFLLQGTILTFLGGLLGLFIGIIVILIQEKFNIIMITESIPYPVIFNFQNILIVMITILSLGYIASWIASSRVNKSLLE